MMAVHRPNERGLAMVTLLITVMIVTLISVSLIGFMTTDMTHASIQYAVARSFYIAQAGLEEAKLQIFSAADPVTYTTPAGGVTEAYGNGRFTYRVSNESETTCGIGLTSLESVGQVAYLNRTLSTRVRACGVAGAPFVTALFGVGRIQLQGGATRLYLAPYLTGTPGGGGSLGSFTEINFSDNSVRVNALNEVISDTLTLRDGRFLDYMLFGFATPPSYDANPMADPAPWILSVFGDIIKAQPATALAPNPCGTPYACVTVGNSITDIKRLSDLRSANFVQHVYMNSIQEKTLARVVLNPTIFRTRAAQNVANAIINKSLGFPGRDSVYAPQQFYQIVAYLAANPSKSLLGTVFIDGSFLFSQNVKLGDVTLAVGGDLVIDKNVSVAIRHDLSTVSGRRTPGIVVFGAPNGLPMDECGERVNRSGRFLLCEGSTLAVDGLVYTKDGMAIHSRASVDHVGAMYHDNRGTTNPSFSVKDATVVLRFDPLALSVFGQGVAILSWQQLQGRDMAAPPPAEPLALAPTPSTPVTATPTAAPEPPAAVVPRSAAVEPAPASAAVVPPPAAPGPMPASPSPDPPPAVPGPQRASPMAVPAPAAPAPLPASPTAAPPSRALGSQTAPAAVKPIPMPAVRLGFQEFRVQVGAFKSRRYADDLARQLRAQGYPAAPIEGPWIRVWVGPAMSREAAERLAGRLREEGFEAMLIRRR